MRKADAGRPERLESRMRPKGASRYEVLNPCFRQEEPGGKLLGHLVYLKAKARGEKSMPEKREVLEHAEGAAPQDPCDKAKAGLPESQSPEGQTHTHCYSG